MKLKDLATAFEQAKELVTLATTGYGARASTRAKKGIESSMEWKLVIQVSKRIHLFCALTL